MQVEPGLLADMKTAVTEACNNVVLHAYPDDGDGTLEVDARPAIRSGSRSSCATTARECSRRSNDPDEPSLGLGFR